MLGCMNESSLGIAQAAQISPLVDVVDLDGHLLNTQRQPHRPAAASTAGSCPATGPAWA